MVRNQKGFVYPITLCVLILFSTVFTIHMEQILTEKKMLKETETILQQDYYFLSTIEMIKNNFREGIHENAGVVEFNNGQATFDMEELTTSLIQITIHINIEDNEVYSIAYYDRDSHQIIKWIEKN